jgi:hypothetical protein
MQSDNTCYQQQGQHRGPITRAYMEVVEAMLFGFHKSKTGLCFPSDEAIVERRNALAIPVREGL